MSGPTLVSLLIYFLYIYFLISVNWADQLFILQYADVAQQAFSSDAGTTLHLAIPALETLHRAWSSRPEQSKYACFAPALTAAAQKLNEYYEKMTDSPGYIMAMCAWFWFYLFPVLTSPFDPQYLIKRGKWFTSRSTGQKICRTRSLLVQKEWYVKFYHHCVFTIDIQCSSKPVISKWAN
jgi:hypothetical protein